MQVKTHLQSQANAEIAVGHQHHHIGGMAGALRTVFLNDGLPGLWRGVVGAVIRVSVGSATQLTTFSWTKEKVVMLQVHINYIMESVCGFVIHFKRSSSLVIDNILPTMTVSWIRGKIIRTVLCCIKYDSSVQWYTHTWAVFTLSLGLHPAKHVDKEQQFVEWCPHAWGLKLVLTTQQINILLPSELWRCWLGVRKSIRPIKNWVTRCWHGYLSGARYRWFAYGPADATAILSFPASLKCRFQTGLTILSFISILDFLIRLDLLIRFMNCVSERSWPKLKSCVGLKFSLITYVNLLTVQLMCLSPETTNC